MNTNLFELLDVKEIPESLNYWFIRTNGGQYYDDFYRNDYVAISWDFLTVADILTKTEKETKTIINNHSTELDTRDDVYEGVDKPSRRGTVTQVYNKNKKFVVDLKIGDIVVVPSFNSDFVLFGTVESDVYENKDYVNEKLASDPDITIELCPYYKRREVKWLASYSKQKLDAHLREAFRSQHALSDMKAYAPYIDRLIYPLYVKNGTYHSTFRAGTEKGATLSEFVNFINLYNDALGDIGSQLGLEVKEDDIQLKINVQSEGIFEVISGCMQGGMLIAIAAYALTFFVAGGKQSLKYKNEKQGIEFEHTAESKGILKSINESKELRLKREKELLQAARDFGVEGVTQHKYTDKSGKYDSMYITKEEIPPPRVK